MGRVSCVGGRVASKRGHITLTTSQAQRGGLQTTIWRVASDAGFGYSSIPDADVDAELGRHDATSDRLLRFLKQGRVALLSLTESNQHLVYVDNTIVLCDNTGVAVLWTPSADNHGIDRDEVLWAMNHATTTVAWPPAREGRAIIPTLFVGPSRFGILEVLAEIGQGSVVIFHAMPLRATTQRRLDQDGGTQP